MRFLKICLMIFSVLIVCSVLYVFWIEFSKYTTPNITVFLYIYLGVAMFFAILSFLYHIKSFRFYRRQEKRNLDKKLHKFFWIGTICFSSFLLYIAGTTLYNMLLYIEYGYNSSDARLILFYIIPGLLGFLEASILKKRIKRLKTERDTKEEIDDIGNLIT